MIRFLATLITGLYTTVAQAETSSHTLQFDGKERSYELVAPTKSGDSPLPLVIALHPYPGNGTMMAELTGFSALAEKEDFLVAYPNGLNDAFNAIICCGEEDDVGFIAAMVEKIAADHPVDRQRIYATGISNGGDMTYKLAARLPGVFAAIGPVSGGMSGDWMGMKKGNLPPTPVSLITFYGEKDRYQAVFRIGADFWLEKQHCDSSASTLAGTNIELIQGKCPNGTEAAIYALPDMGHAWPGSDGTDTRMLAYEASPLKATEMIWKFFKEHPKK
ncbi:MAG: PHB depolymerase family esterase [Rhizobiaceae bacterium]